MNTQPWRVELTRTATRDLRRLDPPVRRRVTAAPRALAEYPQQPGALRKSTGGREEAWTQAKATGLSSWSSCGGSPSSR